MFLQKLVYQMLLTGFPSLTYNPITKNPFHANFKVDSNSLYINYVLNEEARSKKERYIPIELIESLKLIPALSLAYNDQTKIGDNNKSTLNILESL